MRPQSVSAVFFSFTVLVCLVVFAGCTETITEPVKETTPPQRVLTYPVGGASGFRIDDTLSGAIFTFPQGGSGTLVVRLDTSIVSADSVIKGFTLEYDGNGSIIALIRTFPNGYSGLMRYHEPEMVISEEDTIFLNWYTVPVVNDSDGYRYCLVEGVNALRKSEKGGRSGRFLSFSHSEHAQATKTWNYFSAAVALTIDSMVALMPPGLAVTARSRITGDYTYTVSVYDLFRSLYSPQYRAWWRDIMLLSNNDLSNVAHETGHYLHHVLVGTEKFNLFAGGSVGKHWVGMTKSRTNLIEEYAYWVEFMMTGFIKGSLNPANGSFVSGGLADNNIDLNRDPGLVDFPSLEGFTVAMFAAVLRSGGMATAFNIVRRELPFITSVTPADIFAWESAGIGAVDQLRDSIESRLSLAERTIFPVIMRSLGWTYRVQGVVAGQDGGGIAGCKVYNVISDGNEEYVADSSETTAADGSYSIRYCYPGSSRFKVMYNQVDGTFGDSALFDVVVDWKEPTTRVITRDTLRVAIEPPKGRVRNVLMNIPGSEPMYGLDLSAGITDDVALVTTPVSLYVRPRFTPTSGAVTQDMEMEYEIALNEVMVKSGTIGLAAAADGSYAGGSDEVGIGTLPLGTHRIRLTLDPELTFTDQSVTDFDQYRIIEHTINVVESYF